MGYGFPNETLHQKAAELLRQADDDIGSLDMSGIHDLIHELQLRQIELKMQNEASLRTRDELEMSQQEYRDLYDFAPVAYLVSNSQGVVVKANFTASQLLGRPADKIIGCAFSEFINPASQDVYDGYFRDSFKTKEIHSCELELVGESFLRVWLSSRVDDAGDFFMMSLFDVTNLKKAEADFPVVKSHSEAPGVAK